MLLCQVAKLGVESASGMAGGKRRGVSTEEEEKDYESRERARGRSG